MDPLQYQNLGWATAAAVLVITAAALVWRRWRSEDEKRKVRDDLLEKFRAAVRDGDLELASAIAGRLRRLGVQV